MVGKEDDLWNTYSDILCGPTEGTDIWEWIVTVICDTQGGQTSKYKLWRPLGTNRGDRHLSINCDGHLVLTWGTDIWVWIVTVICDTQGGQTTEYKLWQPNFLHYDIDNCLPFLVFCVNYMIRVCFSLQNLVTTWSYSLMIF